MADDSKPIADGIARSRQVVDLTGPNRLGRDVEIITPGGVVRVYADLVTAREGLPAVTVEIVPSTRYKPTSGDGGHWESEVRDYLTDRTDVTLVRKGDI
jgi:hypothetical protein